MSLAKKRKQNNNTNHGQVSSSGQLLSRGLLPSQSRLSIRRLDVVDRQIRSVCEHTTEDRTCGVDIDNDTETVRKMFYHKKCAAEQWRIPHAAGVLGARRVLNGRFDPKMVSEIHH